MKLREDPNYPSRVLLMKQARLNSIVESAIVANAEALAEVAFNITDDLITQHTLVSLADAQEMRDHFNLGKES